ncbi:MAG: hypothetical protein WBE86_03415 [Candidatus Acidiferrales bacterium]
MASLWLLTFAATAPAQDASSQNLDQNAKQTIVLPLELVAAQPVTLAVLTANGHIAPGVKVVLSSGEVVTTDESGRAHFLVPPEKGLMFARIPGTEVREAADVLPQGSGSGSLQLAQIPKLVSLENHFAISGSGFQGDADRNRIEAGGKAILVLASSPVQLVVIPPANAPLGPASLVTIEGATEIATQITFVEVVPSNTSEAVQIRRGKKAAIVLRVRGTAEPLDLEIRNLSPQVAQFPHSNEMRVRTAGGSDNSAVIRLKGMSAGPFSYAVSLENTSRIANAPMARDFLEAARKIAQPAAVNRVSAILKELRGDNVDAVKIRNNLRAISDQGGSEDFQALIRAAFRALDGE